MKFCPRCEKTAQRYCLTKYFDESNGGFETALKLVYGTLDDSCNNITSYFFAPIKFSLTVCRITETESYALFCYLHEHD